MATSVAKRRGGKANSRPRKAARVRQVSWFDRLLQALPFSQAEVQRFLTWGILAILLGVALLIATWLGVPKMLYRQFGEITAKAGFEVQFVETTGNKRVDQLRVYDIVLNEMEKPMLLVDLDRIRGALLEYAWIKDVRISRRLPDTLVVAITERKPSAVWQRGDKYMLLDEDGKPLDKIAAGEIGKLPIVSGDRANTQLVALGKLLDQAQSLKGQVASAAWIGNRRWDIRFRSGEILQLPEGEELAAQALVNFTRMDGIHRLLGRNIINFDLRDPERMYMRKLPKAAQDGKVDTKPAPSSDKAKGDA